MSKITSHWTSDCFNQRVLVVEKKRGSISQAELADYLLHELKNYGVYVTILNAIESACEVGWPEDDQANGDKVLLYPYDHDGEHCPVCGQMSVPDYCVKCGYPIDLARDYGEPITVVRGGIERRQPFYQLACSYTMEGGCGMEPCGVADSMEGIMQLMHDHARTLLYLSDQDPFLQIPQPKELPATIEFEWDYARVQVEYSIAQAPVLLRQDQ